MATKEDIDVVLEYEGITDLEIDIDDFNRQVKLMVEKRLEQGGPLYGLGNFYYEMGATCELLEKIIDEHRLNEQHEGSCMYWDDQGAGLCDCPRNNHTPYNG